MARRNPPFPLDAETVCPASSGPVIAASVSGRSWTDSRATSEGWNLYVGEHGIGLEPNRTSDAFASKGHAVAFVRDAARQGSRYHRDALKLAKLI